MLSVYQTVIAGLNVREKWDLLAFRDPPKGIIHILYLTRDLFSNNSFSCNSYFFIIEFIEVMLVNKIMF